MDGASSTVVISGIGSSISSVTTFPKGTESRRSVFMLSPESLCISTRTDTMDADIARQVASSGHNCLGERNDTTFDNSVVGKAMSGDNCKCIFGDIKGTKNDDDASDGLE